MRLRNQNFAGGAVAHLDEDDACGVGINALASQVVARHLVDIDAADSRNT